MKITFEKLNEKRQLVVKTFGFVEKDAPINTKFDYFFRKWLKLVDEKLIGVQKQFVQQFEEKKADIEIDNALEKDGILLKNEKGELQYSKEGAKKLNKELLNLTNNINTECNLHEIEIIFPLYEEELPKSVSEDIIIELQNYFIK